MKFELVQLSPSDSDDVYDMLQHIGPSENAFRNDAFGLTYAQFKDWLAKLDGWSRAECLPEGYVRQWTYWLLADGLPVGYGKIREKLTDESRRFGGNIGYAVDSRYRGRGFGTELMVRLLMKASDLGIKEKLLTVEKFNYASKFVIEKCGARLINESDERWYFSA